MWTDFDSDQRKGSLPNSIESNLNTVWWWFGRHIPSTYNVTVSSSGTTTVSVSTEARRVHARACTSTGCGSTAGATIGIPGPPASVDLRVAGNDQLEVAIKAPEDDGGANVTHYKFWYYKTPGSELDNCDTFHNSTVHPWNYVPVSCY